MRRGKKTSPKLSDKDLLADAWRELNASPRVTTHGTASSARSRVFTARRRGLCPRCGRWIDRGDDIRYHADFAEPVHSGCRPPDLTVKKLVKTRDVTGSRQPPLCPDCHLHHAGPCW